MTARPVALVLAEAEKRLGERAEALLARIDASDESAWPEYCETIVALKALVGDERAPLLSTQELARKLGVTPKTVLRRARKSKPLAGHELIRLGSAGRAAIRWRA